MHPQHDNKPKPSKKDLLKAERQTFSFKRDEEGNVERIIGKLMAKRDKPAIGAVPKSPLLNQLQSFMPLMKQANQKLEGQSIPPEMTIDAKLQEISDSSDSDSDEEGIREGGMQEQVTPQVLSSTGEVQLDIMTYPYLNSAPQVETQQPTKPKPKIEEMDAQPQINPLEELE